MLTNALIGRERNSPLFVRERSNHPLCMKKGIIKGFADKARALFDDQHLGDKLQKEDVFVANGYDRKVVKQYMKKNDRGERETEE